MSSSSSFYSCPRSSSPELLAQSGATKLSISYKYEVETLKLETRPSASASLVDEAVRRVQVAMVQSVADQSGLSDCGGMDHPWRRLNAGTEPSRRLRAGGRGSNSIVGLSSESADSVLLDVPCRAETPANTRMDPFESTDKEVTSGLTGAVVRAGDEMDGGNSSEEADNAGDAADGGIDVILASTRIDGRVSVQKSIHHTTNKNSHNDANDIDLAFNYISTQSKPIERSSHSSHNPLSSPAVFSQHSQINTRAHAGTAALIQPRSISNRKCTVVQGRMTVYTSNNNEAYENLEGRILAALSQEVNNDNGVDFTDDVVLGVRMYDSSVVSSIGTQDAIATSPGYVTTAIKGGLVTSENSANNSSWSASISTTQMAILATLGALLIILVGLFVKTSKPRGNTRSNKLDKVGKQQGGDEPSVHTHFEDESEMDIEEAGRELNGATACDDSLVGHFSISSARDTVYPNKEFGNAPVRKGSRVIVSKSCSPDRLVQESAYFGLYYERPCAAGPDNEIEVDIQSVYDCDATDCDNDDENLGRVANLMADIYGPLSGEQPQDIISNNINNRDEPRVGTYYDDEVDFDEVEIDVKDLKSFDDYSVGQFSISSYKTKSSLLPPNGVFKSPSTVNERSRSEQESLKDGGNAVVSPDIKKKEEEEEAAYVESDDGSVTVLVAGNPMLCSVYDSWSPWLPEWFR